MTYKNFQIITLALGLLSLFGCSVKYPEITDPPQVQAAAIKSQGGSYKVGNPYMIFDKWYYPREDYNYSEIGEASWYGPDFHNKITANGEKYNMNSLTAAHRTLPIPSIIKVTNLENGRSLVLRINDRGPYAKNRIIDISKKGAQLLGFVEKGTARVKVEILEKESKNLKVALTGKGTMEVVSAPSQTIAKGSIGQEALFATEEQDRNILVKSGSKDGFFVQAGAFSNINSAKNLASRLSQFGKVQVVEADVNNKIFYRVRLGGYNQYQDALDTQSKIIEYGISAAHIIEI